MKIIRSVRIHKIRQREVPLAYGRPVCRSPQNTSDTGHARMGVGPGASSNVSKQPYVKKEITVLHTWCEPIRSAILLCSNRERAIVFTCTHFESYIYGRTPTINYWSE